MNETMTERTDNAYGRYDVGIKISPEIEVVQTSNCSFCYSS